jgi:hypothetical protein
MDQPKTLLKGISIEKTNICKLSYTIFIIFTHKLWVLAKDRFSHSCIIDTTVLKIRKFIDEYLREFEAISGAYRGDVR